MTKDAYSRLAFTVRYLTDVVWALSSHASYFPRKTPSISSFEPGVNRCSSSRLNLSTTDTTGSELNQAVSFTACFRFPCTYHLYSSMIQRELAMPCRPTFLLRAGRSALFFEIVPRVSETARTCIPIERIVCLCVSWWLSVLRGFHETVVVGDPVLDCTTTYMLVERSR